MPQTPELVLFSGGAAYGLVQGLAPQFKDERGYLIDGTFDAVGAIATRVREGAHADLLILTSAVIAELTEEGYVVSGSAANIGSVETSIAVRAGDPAPPIGTAAALRATLFGAGEIYFPDPQHATAGIHFTKVLKGLNIFEEIAPRIRTFPNGSTAMRELSKSQGARPIGCTQATEIINTPGVTCVGTLPSGYGLSTVYTAAICANAAVPSEVQRLIDLLTDDASRSIRQAVGFT